MKRKEIQVGDRVAYAKKFLQSIGEITGDMPFARGEVTELQNLGGLVLASINWDRPMPGKVNVNNLIIVAQIPFEQ